MKTLALDLALAFALLLTPTVTMSASGPDTTEEAAIQQVIQEAYIDGLENLGDLDRTRAGFHPAFVLLHLREGRLESTPIADWIASAERRKSEGQGPRGTTVRFASIDITGHAAVARIELYRDSSLVFTDYLSLYRFDDGWRIVGKVYHPHG